LPAEKDPFNRLIPFAIAEKLSVYQERKESLVREELRRIDEHNQLVIGSLASMNLPGAIQALESTGSTIPPALKDKMDIARKEGAARLVIEQIDAINNMAEEDSKILEAALKKLDDEEKGDNEMRQKYGVKWQRTPSHTLTMNLRQEAAKYKENIDHARKSDSFVGKKFSDHQQFITKLGASQVSLIKMFEE
jgi:programmed cell death 6-interacting protein